MRGPPGPAPAQPVPVPLVRIDAADDDIVAQHDVGRHVGRGEPDGAPAGPDARQADDAARPDGLDRVGDDLADPVHSTMTSGSKPTSLTVPLW